ncbi:MAG: hypothetical protein RL293_2021, partial [Bacteroidota bacterium]
TEQWRIKKSFLDSARTQYEQLSKKLGFNYVSTPAATTVSKSIITDFQVDLSTGGISKLIVQNEDLTAQDLPDDLMQFIYSKGIAPMEFYRPQNIQPSNEWEDENRKSIQLNMELEKPWKKNPCTWPFRFKMPIGNFPMEIKKRCCGIHWTNYQGRTKSLSVLAKK